MDHWKLKEAIYKKSDLDLITLIKKEFYWKSSISIIEYQKKLKIITKLDENTRHLAMARMSKIEESFDSSKIIQPIIIILLAIVASYSGLFGGMIGSKVVENIITIACSLLIFFYILSIIGKTVDRKAIAVYFKKLLEYENK